MKSFGGTVDGQGGIVPLDVEFLPASNSQCLSVSFLGRRGDMRTGEERLVAAKHLEVGKSLQER